MFLLWRRRGRDPELNRSIVARYEPPKDMRPAEAGTLMDFSVDPNDLSATIIDLAVRGYVRIEEVPGKRRAKDHIIHILKGTEAEGLKDFEREVIKGLDGLASYSSKSDTKRVRVSKLKQKFYKYVKTKVSGGPAGGSANTPSSPCRCSLSSSCSCCGGGVDATRSSTARSWRGTNRPRTCVRPKPAR